MFLVVAIPIFFFIGEYEALAEKDEKNLLIEAKNLLVSEMLSFSNALNPVDYIEKATLGLEAELGVTAEKNLVRPLIPMPENEGLVFSENAIAETIKFFKDNYRIEPFLIFFRDRKNSLIYTKYDLFKSEDEKISDELLKRYFKDSMYKLLSSENTSASARVNKAFNQYLSAFSDPPLHPARCEYFYSLKFGNQKSFHIFNSFKNTNQAPSLYYFCFNEMDIDLESLQKSVLNAAHPKAKREYVSLVNKEQSNLPYFSHEEGQLVYYHDFPVDFYTMVRNNLSFQNKQAKNLLKRMDSSCLAVRVTDEALKSKYHTQIAHLQHLLWALTLIFLALNLKFKMSAKHLQMGLSIKIKLAISFMVFIPIIGFVVITDIINRESHSMEIYECQVEMNLKAKLLEQLFSSADLRLMVAALSFKKDLTPIIALNKGKSRITYLPYIPYREGLEWIENVRFLTNDLRCHILSGINYLNFKQSPLHEKNPMEMLGYFQIMQNMDLLAKQNRRVDAEVAKLEIALGGTSNFWSSVAPRHSLSLESYIGKPMTDIETVKRAVFQLLANPENPNKPSLLTMLQLRTNGLITYLHSNLIAQNLHLFEHSNPTYQIHTNMFLTNKQKVFPNRLRYISNNDRLYNLARQALKSKSAINSSSTHKNKTLIQHANYLGNSPFVVASEAIIEKTDIKSTVYITIALLLLIYCICSIALLSDIIGVIFLAPIKTFLAFVEGVERGNLNAETRVESDNELKELSLSLNTMGKGLLEREKMRRFVSDKLYEALDVNSKETTGHAQVSILFSDIRSFTTISESYPPEEIVSMLNEYFTLMESAISEFDGSIEKIIGDAIVAAFYENTELAEHHSIRSCKAALLMKKKLLALNEKRLAEGEFTIENGIGISTGEVYLGFAGKKARRKEFLLVGDPVDKAESLEEQSKQGIASKIFVDKATIVALNDAIPLAPLTEGSEHGELL